MENLAPPLSCVWMIKDALRSGYSVRYGLQQYFQQVDDDFSLTVQAWLRAIEQTGSGDALLIQIKSPYRRMLLRTMELGLQGHSIYERLLELEKEILFACESEIDEFVQTLPIKAMVPLILFFLPAFFILLLSPVYQMLFNGGFN